MHALSSSVIEIFSIWRVKNCVQERRVHTYWWSLVKICQWFLLSFIVPVILSAATNGSSECVCVCVWMIFGPCTPWLSYLCCHSDSVIFKPKHVFAHVRPAAAQQQFWGVLPRRLSGERAEERMFQSRNHRQKGFVAFGDLVRVSLFIVDAGFTNRTDVERRRTCKRVHGRTDGRLLAERRAVNGDWVHQQLQQRLGNQAPAQTG